MSATTVLLTLPGDVVQRAVRVMVDLSTAVVTAPLLARSAAALADYRRAANPEAHVDAPPPAGDVAVIESALLVSGTALDSYRAAVETVVHENEPQPCPWCQHRGHVVRWRAYPVLDPGPCPPGGVLTEQVEACCCCLWGTGPGPQRLAEPLMDRLQREAHHGRDIHVEHLGRDGRWSRFETRF